MEIERTITLLVSHYARLRDNYFIARQVLLAGIESQKKKKLIGTLIRSMALG